MLEPYKFISIVENAPLVPIDIGPLFKGKRYLDKRNDQYLKGEWFNPGRRVFKNEPLQECIRRVIDLELEIIIKVPTDVKLMSLLDHFNENSLMDDIVCFEDKYGTMQ
jgi:colanic acid biosynthesis protein WcaH